MNSLFYPPKRVFSFKQRSQKMTCPICDGRGEKLDAKTKQLRTCAGCKGEGSVKDTSFE